MSVLTSNPEDSGRVLTGTPTEDDLLQLARGDSRFAESLCENVSAGAKHDMIPWL